MTIKFIHIRNTETIPGSGGMIQVTPKGGMTIAYKQLSNGDTRIGVSVCCHKDHFNMRVGRIKAEARMLSTNRKWSKTIQGGASLEKIRMVGKIMGINLVPVEDRWNKYRWMTKHSIKVHNNNTKHLTNIKSNKLLEAYEAVDSLAPGRSLSV